VRPHGSPDRRPFAELEFATDQTIKRVAATPAKDEPNGRELHQQRNLYAVDGPKKASQCHDLTAKANAR
jgi:hypothetical protein